MTQQPQPPQQPDQGQQQPQPPMAGQQPLSQARPPQGYPAPAQPPVSQGQPAPAPQQAPRPVPGYPTPQGAAGQQPVPPHARPLQQKLASGVKHKVHHSYVWLSSIQVVISLAIVFAITLFPIFVSGDLVLGDFGGMIAIAATFFVLILIVGLVIGLQALSYKHLSYEIGDKEFTLYSGVFSKKQVHVPYQRIQSVNQRATLTQRILGICTVHIDTAGGSSNKAVVVPYVQKAVAEQLRTELFARKQLVETGHMPGQPAPAPAPAQAGTVPAPAGAPSSQSGNVLDMPAAIANDVQGIFGGAQTDLGAISYQYKMSNKELFLTGFSNSTGFIMVIAALLMSIYGVVSFVLETTIGEQVVNEGISMATRAFSDKLIWIVVGGVIVIAIVVWVLSILGTCLSYGGFKATRRQTRIEVEYGILQHQFHGVDIDRVQSVIIKQSFIRRLMGYCELSLGKIDAMSEAQEQQQQQQLVHHQGLVIHPFVKMKRVPEILAGLAPEFADVPTEQISLPGRSLRRALIRRCVWQGSGLWLALTVTAALIAAHVFGPWIIEDTGFNDLLTYVNWFALAAYVVCAIIFVIDILRAVLWYRGSSFAYNRRFMQITNGGFSRESISFPRKKIQYAFVQTNPFQRMAHVATINARTAAGIGGTTMKLLDVREEDADKWLEWIIPGNAVVK